MQKFNSLMTQHERCGRCNTINWAEIGNSAIRLSKFPETIVFVNNQIYKKDEDSNNEKVVYNLLK